MEVCDGESINADLVQKLTDASSVVSTTASLKQALPELARDLGS